MDVLILALLAVVVLALGLFSRAYQKNLRQEREAIAQLREVDKLKDEFLANTSHELRTPLHGITGLAESLLDGGGGELSDKAKSHLTMIVTSGRKLSGLIDDILDFSKLSAEGLELARRPVDLHALTALVLRLLEPLAADKRLALVNTVPKDLPPADADETRLEQILHNLIGNAIKFTDAGQVEVAARAQKDEIRVRVSDTGIGIARAKLEHIFGAFEQADASTQRMFGGTGLGLAITRQIVTLHGGRIWAESTPGHGSTFFFTLPVSSEPMTENLDSGGRITSVRVVTEEIVPRAPEEAAPASGAARILIVDDEPVIRQVLLDHLAPDYQVTQAASGQEALEQLTDAEFDLVLLDLMMPKMSGYEVCRVIRRRHSLEDLPVIMLTAKDRVSDLVDGFARGANDYLTKPVTKNELLARVETHLRLLGSHRDLNRLVEERTARIKILSGLLPICAHCKKIRDDEKGSWSSVESYIDHHSEASFSHGLCPDCVRKHYPGVELD